MPTTREPLAGSLERTAMTGSTAGATAGAGTHAGAVAPPTGLSVSRVGLVDLTHRYAFAFVFVLGTVLRLRQYFYGRSLWVDEAFLALNIAQRSFSGLTRPLAWDQTAPILFLWLERAAVALFGVTELALRLVPLLAGLALIPVVYALGRHLFGRGAGLFAAAVAVLSPLLIRYSNEVDSYSVDALVTAVLALLTLRVVSSPGDRRMWLLLGLAGCVGILGSTPAVFTLAGVGAALLAAPSVRRVGGGVRRTVLLGTVWCGLFALVFITLLRPAAGSEFLHRFFAPAFLDPRAPDFQSRLVESVWRTVGELVALAQVPSILKLVVVTVAAFGLVLLARRFGLAAVALFAVPFAAVFVASAIEQYPILPRTMLFAAPLVIVLLAAGVVSGAKLLPRAVALPVGAAAVAALTVPAAVADVRGALSPWHGWDMRPVVRDLERRAAVGEPVYLTYYTRPGYAFYTTDWSAPDTARLTWLDRARSPRAPGDLVVPESRDGRDPFAREYRGRVELTQRRPPGLIRTVFGVYPKSQPWSWPERDAERIRAHARPSAWVLFGGTKEPVQLLDALAKRGMRVVYRNVSAPNLYLYRVRLDSPAH